MKLRVHKNELRLRLSQTEVTQITAGETVSEYLFLGDNEENSLKYSLQPDSGSPEISVAFSGREIVVKLPTEKAKEWGTTEMVGLSHTIKGNGKELSVLIEKDFQCLHKRSGEDELDNFPHPGA